MENRWGNSGNSDRLFSWAPKSLQMVTPAMKLRDGCSLEESYDQPRQGIKKQWHYFADKGPSSQSYGFPVIMYGCESWTIKKAEHRRIDAFELWCWRRLLRIPWTARRSNWSILKEISPGCSLEGLMLKLKLHLIWIADSFEKTLMQGKIEGGRRRGWQRMRWCMASSTEWTWVWVNSGGCDRQGGLAHWGSWCHKKSYMTEPNWTEQIENFFIAFHLHNPGAVLWDRYHKELPL